MTRRAMILTAVMFFAVVASVAEGVLFYKVWNGHSIQLRTEVIDMPAFEGKLSKDDVWAVVEYLKVLRTPAR